MLRAEYVVIAGSYTERRAAAFPFTLSFPGDSQSDGRMNIHGTTVLNRRDYKVGSEEMMDNVLTLGDEVKIELNIQATSAR